MSFYQTVEERFYDWNYSHPRFLHSLVRMLKPKVIVEVGCYRALSTCWMAKGLQENNVGHLYTIDDWSLREHVERYGDPRSHAVSNMEACGVREWITILDGKSNEVEWPESCDFVYIDGWHSHQTAEYEFKKSVSLGASLIAFDDTENCVGPRMFTEETNCEGWTKFHIHSDNGLTVFIKDQPKRTITFSQELPNNSGVDLRFMTLEHQKAHFDEASAITGLDYSKLYNQTEYGRPVGT